MKRPLRFIGKRTLLMLFLLPIMTAGQQGPQTPQALIKRGAEVFAQNCTQGYCHGANGVAGGAPRLADRGLDAAYIERTVTFGVAGTPMPAWGVMIRLQDLNAVIAYVESLNGIAPGANSAPPPELPPEAAPGRDLFFDVPHEMGRCSICHKIGGLGTAIAPIRSVPTDVAGLRDLATPHVSTATANGDTFPALVVTQTREETKLYDLTKVPYPLRAFSPSAVKLTAGSTWRHASVLGAYTDAELDSILVFLRAVKQN